MGVLELLVPLMAAGGWLWWIRRTDRFERDPWGLILRTFGLGAVAGVAGLVVLLILMMALPAVAGGIALVVGLAPLHVAGMTSTIYWLPYRRSEWNEPLDGIVYGGAAGIGYGLSFTTLWSLLDDSMLPGFRSALFVIPTFMLTGLIIGHYVSQVRFGPPHKARAMWRRGLVTAGLFLLGLQLAQMAGGAVMGADNPLASIVVYAANTVGWLVAMWAMAVDRKASPYDPSHHRFQRASANCTSCQSVYPVGARYCNRCGRRLTGPWEVQG